MADEPSSETPDGYAKLAQIAADLKEGKLLEPITVRDLLSWFDAQRRGYVICFMIDEALISAGLTTEPYYQHEYIGANIEFRLAETAPQNADGSQKEGEIIAPPPQDSKSLDNDTPSFTIDPTYRIGKLPSANIVLTTVSPNHSIQETITIMLATDFSQLPVMTGERDVKGVIS